MTRLIVLPFRMLRPDPETDFLAFGLADAITSSLSGLQSLVVRSSLAAARFASDSPDLKAIANSAEVDAVLVGTLLRAGDQLRVATQLIETPSSTVLWSHTAQGAVEDLFRLQDDLTGKIVESLSLPLTARERRMLKQDVPSSAVAYERYLRANEMSRDTRQWGAALDLYLQCVQEDPHYAPAWVGVGRMHRMIGKYVDEETSERFAKAETALRRALELNPDLSFAEHLYAHLEVDLGRAEQSMVRLLRRARERSADPELFAGLSHACRYCGLLQASLAAAEQARRLDPKIRISAGHTCFMLGDYARVLEFEPEDSVHAEPRAADARTQRRGARVARRHGRAAAADPRDLRDGPAPAAPQRAARKPDLDPQAEQHGRPGGPLLRRAPPRVPGRSRRGARVAGSRRRRTGSSACRR